MRNLKTFCLPFLFLTCYFLFCLGCPADNKGTATPAPPATEYTVEFDLNGYDALEIPPISVAIDESAGSKWPADPVRIDMEFAGWFDDDDDDDAPYTAETPITKNLTVTAKWISAARLEAQPSAEELAALFDTEEGFPDALSNSWKIWGHRNALITQGFGADPTAMVYKDRLYIYASNDSLTFANGALSENVGYNAGIRGLRVVSSADLANWTDHGLINVGGLPEWIDPLYLPMPDPVTPYPSRSWAPSAVWKRIEGRDRFFIYFANSGDGIGVISADSPTGPWTSPLNKLLIDRNTPNCAADEVTSLFDPGVMVDDNGRAYMYFGGGPGATAQESLESGSGRRIRLGNDMISLIGKPQIFTSPCLFEDNEIARIGNTYYYSYVTNGVSNSFGLGNAQIAYRTSDEPLGEYSAPKPLMNSPQSFFNTADENNHHCIFQFQGETYIAYHASRVAQAIGLGRYRSTQIDKVSVNASTDALGRVTMTRKGVNQIEYLNPYAVNEAETIGIQGGIFTRPDSGASNGMVVTAIDSGDWLALYGVDFGSKGASKVTVRVRTPDAPADYAGAIEIRLDPSGDGVTSDNANLSATQTARIKDGEVVGRIQIKAKAGEAGKYASVTVNLDRTVTGVHNLVFVFYSSLGAKPITKANLLESMHKDSFEFDQWQFK